MTEVGAQCHCHGNQDQALLQGPQDSREGDPFYRWETEAEKLKFALGPRQGPDRPGLDLAAGGPQRLAPSLPLSVACSASCQQL